MDKKNTAGTTPRQRASTRRRQKIFAALRKCIIDKGYSTTTLADIAREAEMSPSHLLYYFSDKSDILSQYFDNVSTRIKERLQEFRAEPALRRIELFSRLFFSGKALPKTEIGFMLECFGVAVHDSELQQQKTELDRFCKDYLSALFEELGESEEGAAYSAEVSYALLVGLRTAVYFDRGLSVDKAHQIFRDEMLKLAQSSDAKTIKRAI